MAIFNYTLPSGNQFRVDAPAGTTQIEADRIFYEQVAAGSLVGYEPGQTLTSAETQLIKFELSRLDRGTAGVDTNPVLAINQGLAITSADSRLSAGANAPILATLLSLPVPISIPLLTEILLTNPIDEADIVLINGDDFPPDSVGANGIRALTEYQVQKLLAQIANLVNQESDQLSQNKGIGKFGFNAYQLEQAGYVKPGTSSRFFAVTPEDFVSVMSSPSVWTGRNGVYNLDSLLQDAGLQNQIQTQLMQQSYNNLLANGIIVATPAPSISISTGQVYTNAGLQSSQRLTAAGLLGSGLLSLSPSTRAALANSPALARLLSVNNVNLDTIASGAVSNLTTGIGQANANFASVGATLTNQITAGVGSLVANASKYGTQATALWARAGNLQNLSLNSIKANLTNLVPPNLSGLTSNLDILGKASGFATTFANPLASLNNVGGALTGQLTNLQGQLTGQLTNLQGQLTGQLTNLQGQLSNLGSLTNIGSLGSLVGGGGDLVSGTSVAAAFNNTVNRATVDAAFSRIIGSAKVPLPIFQYPSLTALAPRLDIQQAQNFLKNLQNQGQSIASQAQGVVGRLQG
jgi:hypothetical protein